MRKLFSLHHPRDLRMMRRSQTISSTFFFKIPAPLKHITTDYIACQSPSHDPSITENFSTLLTVFLSTPTPVIILPVLLGNFILHEPSLFPLLISQFFILSPLSSSAPLQPPRLWGGASKLIRLAFCI